MSPYRHARVAAQLRAKITDGTYRPGDQLPGVREIRETYDVGDWTARAALHTLIEQGIAVAHQGHGTYVAGNHRTGRHSTPRPRRTHTARRLAPNEAPTPGTEDLETVQATETTQPPPIDVALALDIDPEQDVQTVREIFADATGPLGIRTTYTREPTPARQIITHTTARPPTEQEADDIERPGVVLVHDETHLTTHPIRFVRTIYRPEVRLADQYRPRT